MNQPKPARQIKPATEVKIMGYSFKSRNKDSLIEQRNQNSLTHLLKDPDLTLEQKRFLVEQRNPFIYALGTTLTPKNHYSASYADTIKNEESHG